MQSISKKFFYSSPVTKVSCSMFVYPYLENVALYLITEIYNCFLLCFVLFCFVLRRFSRGGKEKQKSNPKPKTSIAPKPQFLFFSSHPDQHLCEAISQRIRKCCRESSSALSLGCRYCMWSRQRLWSRSTYSGTSSEASSPVFLHNGP